MQLTDHAAQRLQQRAIPLQALDLLRTCGRTEYSNGARIRYFDKRRWQEVVRFLDSMNEDSDRLSRMYCLETKEGVVVTVGHRTRRIKRNSNSGLRKTRRRSRRSQSKQLKKC